MAADETSTPGDKNLHDERPLLEDRLGGNGWLGRLLFLTCILLGFVRFHTGFDTFLQRFNVVRLVTIFHFRFIGNTEIWRRR